MNVSTGRPGWIALLVAMVLPTLAQATTTFPNQSPLFVSQAEPPLAMLVLGKDHSLFFEAYNDASDIDGDGVLDLKFKPTISYYGLFDSTLCYSHSGGGGGNNDKFTPIGRATSNTARTYAVCSGSWSGNWLNYVTTSRIDALRKVLYGGYRQIDDTSQTVLRRAYIPQDGHSWAKEYTSVTIDGYDIANFTPLSAPANGTRLFFGNVTMTAGTNCNVLSSCSNLPPLLSVVRTADTTTRVWDWASSESPVLNNSTYGKGTRTNYTVQVAVCTSDYHDNDCQGYPNGQYKPVGLLHEFGADDAMLFGLLTGSYNKNMSGGVLRKVVSRFSTEVNASTGVFSANATIVKALDALRIRDYNNGGTGSAYRRGSYRTGIMPEGYYPDWGNPIAEMMYETLRYFAGKAAATAAFTGNNTDTGRNEDANVGLPQPAWDNPYASNSAANAHWCAKPNMLVMSNVNVSYDSDQLPGSTFASFSGDLSGLDVSAQATAISALEPSVAGQRYIGAVGRDNEDYAPTAKAVTTLANIRGLAPEEPTKQGSYYSASVARYGANTDLNSVSGDQKTNTYVVALASSLPKFEFSVGGRTVSLVPFAKTINGASTNRTKGNYQPTDAIVDLYVESYSSTGAVFRVNYEADEQGNDFDSDVIVKYDISVTGGQLRVVVTPTAQSTGSNQNLGYVISGTNRDGTYLVVQDKDTSLKYFLNVPPGRNAGYCDYGSEANMPASCALLPWINGSPAASTQMFTPGSTAATTLNNPLWFAAKYGIAGRDTTGISGDPDNYFLVTNAARLKSQLRAALSQILQNNNSVAAPAVLPSQSTSGGTTTNYDTYATGLNVTYWSGELTKTTVAIGTANGATTKTTTTVWKASTVMPAWTERNILIPADPGTGSGLRPFTYANLADRTYNSKSLQTNLDAAKVDFLKGDASKETSLYRKRSSLLGDIVNSAPAVASGAQYLTSAANALEGAAGDYATFKTNQARVAPMVYVGANDGMLHGFNANTGREVFAFIPTAVIPNLYQLARSSYNDASPSLHTYYVDGSPVIADVFFGREWRKVLIGTLRGGGSEVFALDITDPTSPKLLWEFTGADIRTSPVNGSARTVTNSRSDSTLGNTFGTPLVVRLHSGQWAVLFGNGYDGSGGKAALYALNVADGSSIGSNFPLVAQAGSNNGLFNLKSLDVNSDGIADYVYGGDLQGNLWRFDLLANGNLTSSASASDFKVSFGGSPLYRAKDRDNNGNVQPITAPPSLVRHPFGTGFVVMFGTGSYFTQADKSSVYLQSVYGIWDKNVATVATPNTATTTTTLNRGSLQRQVFFQETALGGKAVRVISNNSVDWSTVSGWYLDLAYGDTQLGERMVDPMTASGQALFFSTITPNSAVCSAGISGWTYAVDPSSGGRTTFNVFDLNGDGVVNAADSTNGTVISGFDTPAGGTTLSGSQLGSTDATLTTINKGPQASGRQTWRVIPQPQ
ncbi:pilus assembly protein [Pseudomonas oryzihabitans]|uniref:pilus assembly protein n=1 Tax=Pseudomonas oryzihabitans TaxID=47885 RepID=UPI003CFF4EAC